MCARLTSAFSARSSLTSRVELRGCGRFHGYRDGRARGGFEREGTDFIEGNRARLIHTYNGIYTGFSGIALVDTLRLITQVLDSHAIALFHRNRCGVKYIGILPIHAFALFNRNGRFSGSRGSGAGCGTRARGGSGTGRGARAAGGTHATGSASATGSAQAAHRVPTTGRIRAV